MFSSSVCVVLEPLVAATPITCPKELDELSSPQAICRNEYDCAPNSERKMHLSARGLLQAAQILNQNRMAQRISFLFEKTKSLFVSADNFGPVTMLSFPLRHSLHAEANWLLFKCCLIHHYVKRLSSSVGSHIFFLHSLLSSDGAGMWSTIRSITWGDHCYISNVRTYTRQKIKSR
jgi:hypothetical protein